MGNRKKKGIKNNKSNQTRNKPLTIGEADSAVVS